MAFFSICINIAATRDLPSNGVGVFAAPMMGHHHHQAPGIVVAQQPGVTIAVGGQPGYGYGGQPAYGQPGVYQQNQYYPQIGSQPQQQVYTQQPVYQQNQGGYY
ncbi:MAG: hypothetical protein RIT23_1346 [Actinomycetota bacterium]